MITQSIRRWLNKLFAWWPWRRSPMTSYTRAGSNSNPGVTPALRNIVDGPVPQTGNTSVAVEQGRNAELPDASRPTPEQPTPTHPPQAGDTTNPRISPEALKETTEALPPPPTPEQKLAFLQYLVKRGIVNEGFGEGQVPRQYKKAHRN